jgi:hypothetical protein
VTRFLASAGNRGFESLLDQGGRMIAELLAQLARGLGLAQRRMRQGTGQHLVRGTLLACAILNVLRRTRVGIGLQRAHQRSRQHLARGVLLAYAILSALLRTRVSVELQRTGQRIGTFTRDAWAEAEGFQTEAAAGVALVVLTIIIVLHGYFSV